MDAQNCPFMIEHKIGMTTRKWKNAGSENVSCCYIEYFDFDIRFYRNTLYIYVQMLTLNS